MKPITENTLFYGDNLLILREYILSKSVDLIYLDPPFHSNRNHNVFFKEGKIDSSTPSRKGKWNGVLHISAHTSLFFMHLNTLVPSNNCGW